jgi:bifunctional DNase/RNase
MSLSGNDELAAQRGEPVDTSAAPDPLATPPGMKLLVFVDVVLLLPATHPVVVLQEAEPPFRELRIPVGGAEGIAIGYAARGLETPRPLTHELFTRVLETFGMTLDAVRITDVRGAAFSAEIVVSGPDGAQAVDCRPSDAIALALRQRTPVPIMARAGVLDEAGTDPLGAN